MLKNLLISLALFATAVMAEEQASIHLRIGGGEEATAMDAHSTSASSGPVASGDNDTAANAVTNAEGSMASSTRIDTNKSAAATEDVGDETPECDNGMQPVSVEGVEGSFCVEETACAADIQDGNCPGKQDGLPEGSECKKVSSGVYGCVASGGAKEEDKEGEDKVEEDKKGDNKAEKDKTEDDKTEEDKTEEEDVVGKVKN